MKEDEFIFNSARLHLAEKNIAALKELAGGGLDWQVLSQKASTHGVSQFIYYAFKQHGLTGLLPKEVFDKFKIEYYDTAVRNFKLLDTFRKIASLLPNRIVPLKGIELAQSLYPNIAIRSMCDIDVLVDQDCAEENWHRLREHGFMVPPDHVHVKSAVHKNLMMQEAAGHLRTLCLEGTAVEIHWTLFREKKFDWINKEVLDDAVKMEGNIFRMSNEMVLIHLCLHVYRHINRVILRTFCDINELVLKHKDTLKWNVIEKICSDSSLRSDVAAVLSCAHILLGTPIPESFFSEKILKKKEIIAASFLHKGTLHEVLWPALPERLERYFYDFKEISNPVDKAVFIFRTFVPVKEWMAEEYDVSTGARLAMAYPRYWLHLLKVYLGGKGAAKFNESAKNIEINKKTG